MPWNTLCKHHSLSESLLFNSAQLFQKFLSLIKPLITFYLPELAQVYAIKENMFKQY